uniref:Uncharacterized protein n=2 Tax=Eukaryota TaxID=2759 RepID=A0A6S8L2C6_DUNTE|mmetsp:Transcript_26797/g.72349  ORF Transcript_26797/g.72349 Transcript_26797/m.72349 type:complete len:310 (+) Transcript_26797:4374-5303(+)|eukprot:CAMPEP_0202346316 /NCGR_PEP_ID=MMETSP1126-20121109/5157_1 /ASSEMBLY_ACC=CAM_ASM_000457 /TAXON_ID=3047 /ORGANISM="Dunaliella tertiolecta, Strain CCMP1320" /LENGTH=309 /DNA_ID=CAMNT_0048937703 /DNA_START=1871 /DNA_END=2800 /DNA_ORIENTATION=-
MKGTQLTSSPLARSNPCLSSSRSLPCRPAHLAIQRLPVRANAGGEAKPTADTSPALKGVWYAAELFGKIVGKQQVEANPSPQKKMTRDEMIDSIRADYAKNYFVSGAGEMAAYAEDCVFADPFVAFPGTKRFKQNVSNLGGQMQDIKLKVYDFQFEGDNKVHTKWRFSCILNLPWKPLLAAAGGTTHVLDLERGQIVEHIEQWDIEPSKVVSQLFKPSAAMPSSNLETFLLSSSDNDPKGMWAAASPFVIRLSLGLIAASTLGSKLLTGEVNVELLLVSLFSLVVSLSTEVLKFARGMQGGETGTGGRF